MKDIKIGDKLRRVRDGMNTDGYLVMYEGDIGTISKIKQEDGKTYVYFVEFPFPNNLENYELVKSVDKYYVHYVEDCQEYVFVGHSEEDVIKFLKDFKLKHGSFDDKGDNWVQLDKIYKGTKIEITQDIQLSYV